MLYTLDNLLFHSLIRQCTNSTLLKSTLIRCCIVCILLLCMKGNCLYKLDMMYRRDRTLSCMIDKKQQKYMSYIQQRRKDTVRNEHSLSCSIHHCSSDKEYRPCKSCSSDHILNTFLASSSTRPRKKCTHQYQASSSSLQILCIDLL